MSSAVERPREDQAPRRDPAFEVLGAAPRPATVAPTLVFTLLASVPEPHEVYTIALTADLQLEPARRAYDDATKVQLVDLFGTSERWAGTTHNLSLARLDVLVPSFRGSTTFELLLPCTYDLEVAASKYLYALTDGDAPLAFHFSGTVFYAVGGGRMELEQVPWSASARFGLPVDTWRTTMSRHYGSSGWIRLHGDTLARLRQHAADRGSPTFDTCVAELLDGAGP